MKTVKVELTGAGIDKAITDLEKYKSYLKVRSVTYRVLLAQKLKEIAKGLYESAWYNDVIGDGKTTGESMPAMFMTIENSEDRTALVVNNSVAVFIEFGAGVYHNTEPFTSPHPWGAQLGFTIGSYPEHKVPSKGINPVWEFEKGRYTRGTEAQMVLYRAVRYLEPYLEELAREAFND